MDAKVEVAKAVVELCEKRESICRVTTLGEADVNKLVEEAFAKVRRAFQLVIDAASASQPKPVDFKNGEPGVTECRCPFCTKSRENRLKALTTPIHIEGRPILNPAPGVLQTDMLDATMLERIRCATIANNGAATLRARGKDEAADALLSVRRDIENGTPARFPIDARKTPVSEK